MPIDVVATIVYGALTLFLTFMAAIQVHSFWAMALTILATGLSYVFQAWQVMTPVNGTFLWGLWAWVLVCVLVAWGLIACA